jgi:hypothetical protein
MIIFPYDRSSKPVDQAAVVDAGEGITVTAASYKEKLKELEKDQKNEDDDDEKDGVE